MLRIAPLTLALALALTGSALGGPPAVLLGTAGEYAVLGGSGMTNTGTSTITGDVGSSPTHDQTGFGAVPRRELRRAHRDEPRRRRPQ